MISIIMPVFNVEKYLERAIRSVLAQTFGDYELLLIDDGSTDHSGQICDHWAKTDKRIAVFHQEKKGLSAARNLGLQKMKGQFVAFLDSDDCVTENYLEQLHDTMEKYHADVVKCDLAHCYNQKCNWKPSDQAECFDTAGAVENMLTTDISMGNRLYRSRIFEKIRFPEQICMAEDAYVLLDVLEICRKVVWIHSCAYFYMHRKNSITTTKYSTGDLMMIRVWWRNYRKICSHYPQLEQLARMRMIWAYCVVLDKIYLARHDLNAPDTRKIMAFLRKNRRFILKNKHYTVVRKLGIALLLLNRYAYHGYIRVQTVLLHRLLCR